MTAAGKGTARARAAVHGTVVAWPPGGGVLILGPSGAGKSDLALRLIDRGARLVGDDYIHLFASGPGLYASAPAPLAGLLEVRGLGLVRQRYLPQARIALVVHLAARETVERMPRMRYKFLRGVRLPVMSVDPWDQTAAPKVEQAYRRFGATRRLGLAVPSPTPTRTRS
ncbi:hypothetical protein CCR85_00760 [Rhodothalassium salexigens]|uniref:Hpr(Ser) kinase/phosphatase n=1 Tax=Rhodothalassium salexigens DSM 2132 TaxID=1188247 RepID=A0A4R2PLA5_RHOSA|nr:HPr kinase/phosphatase C-terminal domain-containing protein [Rhodothalassium salexigens]MBB4210959.1 serine kinase of HPr protein (carbohydrate metabolism regulator) [Rhodothalassium salexigens DSM 2132]MBK1638691.1 hypothetical protein [Rhodothalassium salexigens DSM 2132]MBK5910025.1 hypothetical protein [Rhodothalassium salexigens]MBK5921567.1 hypothetical protein [Rhodothalassium salexigens]TCP36383.1 Hpr(Ser) kinase/phosphatase [Rhodothalassium salexigens DSM 2132]